MFPTPILQKKEASDSILPLKTQANFSNWQKRDHIQNLVWKGDWGM